MEDTRSYETATDAEVLELLVEAEALSPTASRQVKRRILPEARKRLGSQILTREAARRLFGWRTAAEKAAKPKPSDFSWVPIAMMAAMARGGHRF